MPLVISEYGVPSSRGVAHVQPQGRSHGGHSEKEQAEINARLTREIYEAGAAGALTAGLLACICLNAAIAFRVASGGTSAAG